MPPKNEHALRRAVLKRLGDLQKSGAKIWFAKISAGPYQAPGLPDLLICANSYFLAIELKHPDGTTRPTPLQVSVLRKIREAGGGAAVARSVEEVEQIVRAFLGGLGR